MSSTLHIEAHIINEISQAGLSWASSWNIRVHCKLSELAHFDTPRYNVVLETMLLVLVLVLDMTSFKLKSSFSYDLHFDTMSFDLILDTMCSHTNKTCFLAEWDILKLTNLMKVTKFPSIWWCDVLVSNYLTINMFAYSQNNYN